MEDDPNSTINIYIIGLAIGLLVGGILVVLALLFIGQTNNTNKGSQSNIPTTNTTTQNQGSNIATEPKTKAECEAKYGGSISDPESGDGYYIFCNDDGTHRVVSAEEMEQSIEEGIAEMQAECVIKGNISYNTGEKIYHVPGQSYYAATEINTSYGEKWFCSEQEAQAAGWRKAYQ